MADELFTMISTDGERFLSIATYDKMQYFLLALLLNEINDNNKE